MLLEGEGHFVACVNIIGREKACAWERITCADIYINGCSIFRANVQSIEVGMAYGQTYYTARPRSLYLLKHVYCAIAIRGCSYGHSFGPPTGSTALWATLTIALMVTQVMVSILLVAYELLSSCRYLTLP